MRIKRKGGRRTARHIRQRRLKTNLDDFQEGKEVKQQSKSEEEDVFVNLKLVRWMKTELRYRTIALAIEYCRGKIRLSGAALSVTVSHLFNMRSGDEYFLREDICR